MKDRVLARTSTRKIPTRTFATRILPGASPQLHWVAYSSIPSTDPQPCIARASATISGINNL